MIIFWNRKRWNRGIVNRMQHFLGIGKTGRAFHLFRLFCIESGIAGRAGIAGTVVIDVGLLFQNRMISVPFELEQVELGTLIPGIPLPEKSQNGMRPKIRFSFSVPWGFSCQPCNLVVFSSSCFLSGDLQSCS